MKHNNIDMNIGHVYDWYHSLGPSADHRLTGEPGISRFPLRGGKRTGFAGSRQATENPVNPSPCGKSRAAGIGVHCCGASLLFPSVIHAVGCRAFLKASSWKLEAPTRTTLLFSMQNISQQKTTIPFRRWWFSVVEDVSWYGRCVSPPAMDFLIFLRLQGQHRQGPFLRQSLRYRLLPWRGRSGPIRIRRGSIRGR